MLRRYSHVLARQLPLRVWSTISHEELLQQTIGTIHDRRRLLNCRKPVPRLSHTVVASTTVTMARVRAHIRGLTTQHKGRLADLTYHLVVMPSLSQSSGLTKLPSNPGCRGTSSVQIMPLGTYAPDC